MDAIRPLLPVALILSSVATGYLAVLVAVHARSYSALDHRFSIEIVAAMGMMLAVALAFAGGKAW